MDASNYNVFRDLFSNALFQRIATSRANKNTKRKVRKGSAGKSSNPGSIAAESSDAEELAEFVEYLAAEVFESLPEDLQTLSYASAQDDAALKARYDPSELHTTSELIESLSQNIPPSVQESLDTYSLLGSETAFVSLFTSALTEYVSSVSTPPPVWSSTRTSECEICGRGWVPLSYHHLIPKQVHEKVLKRKWHEEWRLNSVAWLCRACHTFVHRCESNEVLAKDYWTVELLLERDDVQQWAMWVSKVRWKAR